MVVQRPVLLPHSKMVGGLIPAGLSVVIKFSIFLSYSDAPVTTLLPVYQRP